MSVEREHIDQVRDELDLEAQRYLRAESRAVAVQTQDRSGSITVRIDADGALEWVRVAETWRTHHDPTALGGAVLEVYGRAADERATAWSEASIETDEIPSRARPTERTSAFTEQLADALSGPAAGADPAVLRELGAILDELSSGFDAAISDVEQRLTSPVVGTSSSGHVRASVVADGALVALDLDERWLTHAHSFNLGREITEAVHAAVRAAAAASVQGLEDSGLERLRTLSSDPQTMIRRLGLDRT